MALIDVQCTSESCAHIAENIYRRAADWQTTPPCEKCGAPTTRLFQPPRTTWRADPVVVYKAPDGTYRYPGATESASTKHYDKLGYERVELRSAADVRRFERDVNKHEMAEGQIRTEAAHRQREARESVNRSELFNRMKGFSNAGKDIARAAMARGNQRPQERTHSGGLHVDVYSNDRGSREPSRGSDGRRRRD